MGSRESCSCDLGQPGSHESGRAHRLLRMLVCNSRFSSFLKMKTLLLSTLTGLLLACHACAQGLFQFQNPSAPTRIGSITGPVAGPGIWGQCLGGPAADSLIPVGVPVEHGPYGVVDGGYVQIPNVPDDRAFVQMVAWDGRLWGTDLSAVPAGQLGRTDTVSVLLDLPPGPLQIPLWTQPAIVPIPEPSVLGLSLLGACVLLSRLRRRTGSGP